MKFDEKKVQDGIRLLIEGIGDDPKRDGLLETPKRVAKMYSEILNGYDEIDKISKHVKLFDDVSEDMVTITNVPFYSFCEHHIIPFVGKLHIAYIPNGTQILGISKLVRIARVFAKRLQVQERLTREIANEINRVVPNQGVAVRIEAEHMCMSIRGVRTPGAKTITTKLTGLFKEDAKARNEFLGAIK
jgi:GTP cyclohydrolase I